LIYSNFYDNEMRCGVRKCLVLGIYGAICVARIENLIIHNSQLAISNKQEFSGVGRGNEKERKQRQRCGRKTMK
jgi:hypothetical protein